MNKNLQLSAACCLSICLILMTKVSDNTATNSLLSLTERREKCEALQRRREKCGTIKKKTAQNPETSTEEIRVTKTEKYTTEGEMKDKGVYTTKNADDNVDYKEYDVVTLDKYEDYDDDSDEYEDDDEESQTETEETFMNQDALNFFAGLENIEESGRIAVLCHGNLKMKIGSKSWDPQSMNTQSEASELLNEKISAYLPQSMNSTALKSAFSHMKVVSSNITGEDIHVSFWMFFDRKQLQDVEEDLFDGELSTFESFLKKQLTENPVYHVASLEVSDIVPIGVYQVKRIRIQGLVNQDDTVMDWNTAFSDRESLEFKNITVLIKTNFQDQFKRLYPSLEGELTVDLLSEIKRWWSARRQTQVFCTLVLPYKELGDIDPLLTVSTGLRNMEIALNKIPTKNGIIYYALNEEPYVEDMTNLVISTSSMLTKRNRYVPWNENFRNPQQKDRDIVKSALYEALIESDLSSHLLGISDVKFNNRRNQVVAYVTMKFNHTTLVRDIFGDGVEKKDIVDEIELHLKKPLGIRKMQYI